MKIEEKNITNMIKLLDSLKKEFDGELTKKIELLCNAYCNYQNQGNGMAKWSKRQQLKGVILSFVEKVFQNQKEELQKKLEKKRKPPLMYCEGETRAVIEGSAEIKGYNQALEDILKVLNNPHKVV